MVLAEAPEGDALLRLIADSVPALVAYIGTDERYRFANRAYERWFGEVASPVGRHLRDVLGEAAYATIRPFVARALAGESVDFAREMAYPGVGPRHVQITYIPDAAADGMVQGFVALVVDDTAQQRAEGRQRFLAEAGEALVASLDVETTLATVADLVVPQLADWCTVHLASDTGEVSRVAIAHVDPEKVAWAKELERRYPYNPHAPRGIPVVLRTGASELYADISDEMLVAAARDEDHLAILRRVGLTSAMVVPLTARGRAVGAISFFAAESGRRFDDQDLALAEELGRRAGLAVENGRLYGRLEATEARYRALFDQMPDAVIVSDAAGRYLELNPAATALLGYRLDDLQGMRVGDLSADPERARESFERLKAGVESAGAEAEMRRKDGTIVPVEVRTTAVSLPTGRFFLASMRDVSARKEQERFAQEFIADLTHDLRNPLAVMRGQVQLMRRRLGAGRLDNEAVASGLATIEANADRVAARIDDLSDVARLRAGHPLVLRPERVNLVTLVAGRVAAYDRSSDTDEVRFETAETDLVGVYDPGRLERALDNLLANAVKYSPQGGEIDVRISREDDGSAGWAVLRIQDRGMGIPADDLPHVFERFRRGANAAAVASGSGLGLAGAKQIVEQHGGAIELSSVEGEGTTVTVRLPLSTVPAGS